ncbi:MAG: type IV pilus twitching motility protein PilT [Candidatus Omnitrophica bacterium]|nr:type IV pilus twitching motility protein PilT [Candidatus Omnitrophota bacterium]
MRKSMDEYLKLTVDKNATDLHLTAGRPPQLRIDGNLVLLEEDPLLPEEIESLSFSILEDTQIGHFRAQKELDTSYGLKGTGRFRINLFYQRSSVGCAIRFIPFEVPRMEDLGLPLGLREFCEKSSGLFLVCGPTGCGKSTTLASMIEYINTTKSCNIVTIEDPIEYLHRHKRATVNQRELGRDTHSFSEALRHSVRQDPDVIMIGEMRDLDTMQAALTLSETGHLVLATLHTVDAPNSIARIIDVFPAFQQQQVRLQLSLVLLGAIVQQLMPRRSGRGRVLAYELMKATPAIKNMIRENTLHQIYSVLQMGKSEGMVTMNQSLIELHRKNIITRDEALKRSPNPEELRRIIL